MTLRSPIVAMLWELWRLTRAEIAWRLALPIGAGVTALLLGAAFGPPRYQDVANINDAIAAFALIVIVLPQLVPWTSIAKLNGSQPGFPFYLAYTRPVRTLVIVGLPMAYFTAVSSAIYLVSAIVLRVTSGYAFPLLPVAAWLAALSWVGTAAAWSTRNRVVQMMRDDVCPCENSCHGDGSPDRSGDPGQFRLASASVADAVRLAAHRLRVGCFDWPGIFRRHGCHGQVRPSRRFGSAGCIPRAPRALADVITGLQMADCGTGSSACSAFRVPPRRRRGRKCGWI
jgi:hypothetical protein